MSITEDRLESLPNKDLLYVKKNIDDILKRRGVTLNGRDLVKKVTKRSTDLDIGIFKTFNYTISNVIDEDWSHLFKGDYDKRRDYYVYFHGNPCKHNISFSTGKHKIMFCGEPFYIGKGKGDRLYSITRSDGHLHYLKKLFERGFIMQDISFILESGLTEKEALILESKLITCLGTKWSVPDDEVWHHRRKGGLLINQDIPPHPEKYDTVFYSEEPQYNKKKRNGRLD